MCDVIKVSISLLDMLVMGVVQVERFKHKQSWEDALHSRFDCYTGDAVTEDNGWGHLQVSCVSLFGGGMHAYCAVL